MHQGLKKEELEDKLYFLRVIATFKSYREKSLKRIQHKERCLGTLPYHHKRWLTKYKEDIEKFKTCVERNAEFIPIVLKHANFFESHYQPSNGIPLPQMNEEDTGPLPEGMDKVNSVFKQLMRDWSSLGEVERNQSYGPIIQEIETNFPDDLYDRGTISVLVPGAGLGRLAFEIASRGFISQGNEFSYFMLIVSYYVLNICKKVNEFVIYPWIHHYCNHISAEDQMISVSFPDVKPGPFEHDNFSITAGDFLEVYTSSDEWHVVATCFFIDCAPNVVDFLEKIFQILKPGGLWINLGPLLYHYSDIKNEKSIEPSFEVLCDVIKNVGFEMEKCETGVKSRYCQNPKSMLQSEYDSVFFVCRKPISVEAPCDSDNNVEM